MAPLGNVEIETTEEIAFMMNSSIGSVRSRIYRGRRLLGKAFELDREELICGVRLPEGRKRLKKKAKAMKISPSHRLHLAKAM